MRDNNEFYQHSPVVLTTKQAERMATTKKRDGWGALDPFPGRLYSHGYGHIGSHRYNGGCIHNDEWYPGEVFTMEVPEGYEVKQYASWGLRIFKTN